MTKAQLVIPCISYAFEAHSKATTGTTAELQTGHAQPAGVRPKPNALQGHLTDTGSSSSKHMRRINSTAAVGAQLPLSPAGPPPGLHMAAATTASMPSLSWGSPCFWARPPSTAARATAVATRRLMERRSWRVGGRMGGGGGSHQVQQGYWHVIAVLGVCGSARAVRAYGMYATIHDSDQCKLMACKTCEGRGHRAVITAHERLPSPATCSWSLQDADEVQPPLS